MRFRIMLQAYYITEKHTLILYVSMDLLYRISSKKEKTEKDKTRIHIVT